MSKRVISCVPAVAAGLLVTVILLGTNYATLAADDCLTEPNRPTTQGSHWYYHVDRASNRKCWYLVEPGGPPPTAEAPQPQPSPDGFSQPTFGSFFSSLGFPRSTTGTQPDTTGDARIMQAARPDGLKNDDARQPRTAHPDLEAALPKPHRPAHARPPAEHADERPAAPLNQAKRDALFDEFLKWKEHQTP
jgi:hypothetical protein